MKIDLGSGSYLEPDDGPHDTPFHKSITNSQRIPGTITGRHAVLECGHHVEIFGDPLALAGAKVLCTQCRDQNGAPE